MLSFIVLIAFQLSIHLFLIALCKAKKQPIVVIPPAKPEEKVEEVKKNDEKEIEKKEAPSEKKSETDKEKKETERKDDEKKVDEKNKDDDSKQKINEKKEVEDEKMAYSPKELHWKSEDGQPKYGTQKILLMNLIGKRQAFKIKCTDNNIYTVKPTYTFLEKDEVVDIEVTRVEGGEVKEDQIFLFYVMADDKDTDAEPLFTKDDDSYEHYTVRLIIDP